MSNGYSASQVASRDTLAIRTLNDALNNHGLRGVPNYDWAVAFEVRNGNYQIVAGERKRAGRRNWFQTYAIAPAVPMPEGKVIETVIEEELRFLRERHGIVNVFIGNKIVRGVRNT